MNKPKLANSTNDIALESELKRLAATPIVQLRIRYRGIFREEPPPAFGPDFLRRSIAHRIQEKAYGKLPVASQRVLNQSIKAITTKSKGQLDLPRRIKPGSEFVRDWKGKTHRVAVIQNGFAYGGKNYASLSEIASLITGTNWNGPRFFGLRSKSNGVNTDGV